MIVKILRGTNQIGGSSVIISTKNAKIVIDFGSELNDNPKKLEVDGLTSGKSDIDAVFFNLLMEAEKFILKNIYWNVENIGMQREETPEIPREVIREVLANSFVDALYFGNTTHEIDIHRQENNWLKKSEKH